MVRRTKARELSYQFELRCFYYKFSGETGMLPNFLAIGKVPGSQLLKEASRSRPRWCTVKDSLEYAITQGMWRQRE